MSNSAKSQILVIIHGQGRGRNVPTGTEFQSQLDRYAPSIAARIKVHQTGTPLPNLSHTDLVLFWLGDPLKESYPSCYAEAVVIASEAELRDIPVINHPNALNNTSKSTQAAIWQEVGLPCQPIRTLRSAKDLKTGLKYTPYPCILRSNRDHAQSAIQILTSEDDAKDIPFDPVMTSAIIPLIDIRAQYRAAGDRGLFARFHHKARAIIAGDKVIASHLFFSKSPIVCQKTSLFSREARPRRTTARRFGFRSKMLKDVIAADLAYFNQPVEHADLLKHSVKTLGLDVAAVDYSFLPNGEIMLWEANPYFSLAHGSQSIMSAERDAVTRVDKTFAELIDVFASLIPSDERLVA